MWTVCITITRVSSILPVIPEVFLTQNMTSFVTRGRWTLDTDKQMYVINTDPAIKHWSLKLGSVPQRQTFRDSYNTISYGLDILLVIKKNKFSYTRHSEKLQTGNALKVLHTRKVTFVKLASLMHLPPIPELPIWWWYEPVKWKWIKSAAAGQSLMCCQIQLSVFDLNSLICLLITSTSSAFEVSDDNVLYKLKVYSHSHTTDLD